MDNVFIKKLWCSCFVPDTSVAGDNIKVAFKVPEIAIQVCLSEILVHARINLKAELNAVLKEQD